MDDALGNRTRGVNVRCAGDNTFQQLGRALAVAGQLTAEMFRHGGQNGDKGLVVLAVNFRCGVARQAVGKEQDGIVGGGVAVHRNLVEGCRHHAGERRLKNRRFHCGVRRDKEQHRGHVGVNHA